MNTTKPHNKVHLSGNDDCCVIFCPECNVLELNLGASTLRISPESLLQLSATLNTAKARLADIRNAASSNGIAQAVRTKRVH